MYAFETVLSGIVECMAKSHLKQWRRVIKLFSIGRIWRKTWNISANLLKLSSQWQSLDTSSFGRSESWVSSQWSSSLQISICTEDKSFEPVEYVLVMKEDFEVSFNQFVLLIWMIFRDWWSLDWNHGFGVPPTHFSDHSIRCSKSNTTCHQHIFIGPWKLQQRNPKASAIFNFRFGDRSF